MNTQYPRFLIAAAVAAALLSGCGKRDEAASPAADTADTPATTVTPAPADAPAPAPADTASAQLAPTQGHTAAGTLTIQAEGDALRISGALQGLTPNAEFGFHIHEKGDCSAPDASSAGGHFNPGNSPHGNPQSATHHAGDMLNAKSDAQGMAQVDAVASGVSLAAGQPNDARGKAIVLHEKADDYATQPSGNSGARIACGVIN
jgi:superoxide dismutase, Cu-Zn family